MLNIKLKTWIDGQSWFGETVRAVTKKKELPSLDFNDLAFKLATAENISETLPAVLKSLQWLINDLFSPAQQPELLVLFSNPSTSETFMHHGLDQAPSAKLMQSLHHLFTVGKAPDTNEMIRVDGLTIAPSRLFDHENMTVWSLFLFRDAAPSAKQLKWKTSSIENTLYKGLQAWYHSESKLKKALESERAMYAAELHDSLAQVLGYLRLKSLKLDKLCQQDEFSSLKPITEDLASYTQCAYHQTRELITSSRLTMQSDNLSQGVINSIKEFEHQSAIVFELDNRLPLNMLSPQQSMQMLYIVRESLSNIVRHSHATHARVVLLLKTSSLIHIHIEDNGTGIDPEAARSDSFGLQIMKERADRIGATLMMNNRPEGGTRVDLSLDLEANE